MVTDIDGLIARLADPTATFTAEETQALIDWYVERAHRDEYQAACITDMQTHNSQVAAYANDAMDRLLAMWDPSPMTPTLEVIPGE